MSNELTLRKCTYLAHSYKGTVWAEHKYKYKYVNDKGKTVYVYSVNMGVDDDKVLAKTNVAREAGLADKIAYGITKTESNKVSNFITSARLKVKLASDITGKGHSATEAAFIFIDSLRKIKVSAARKKNPNILSI